jgi:hypothetical protein
VLSLRVLLSALAVHAASYTFTTLDVPDAFATFAFKINNAGQIVGLYVENNPDHTNHGFLYDGGVFTTLDVPFPDAIHTQALGINDREQIVGVYFLSGSADGFLYDRGIWVLGTCREGGTGLLAGAGRPVSHADADSCGICCGQDQALESCSVSCPSVRLPSGPVITRRPLAAPQWPGISEASSAVVAQSCVNSSPGGLSLMATNTSCPCPPSVGAQA